MQLHFKQLLLLCLTILLSLIAGFITFPPNQAQFIVSHLGPWVMLTTVVLFAIAALRIFRTEFTRESLHAGIRMGWPEIAAVLVCGTLLLVHEPHGFKVLADELVLLDTSRNLHFEREFFTPVRAHDVSGSLVQMGGIIDKRPFFFAFVLSIVHDLLGYRPENVFVLNGAVTFVFLGLAALVGRKLGGKWGGILAVLLLACIPLISQNATGGGFEVFNLMMILCVLLLAHRYIKLRDETSLNALVLGGILLAQTRYESVVYVVAVAAVVLGVWFFERKVRLTWTIIFAPLLMITYPLQNKVFQEHPEFWQLPEGLESPFSAKFLPDNVGHAVQFLFGLSTDQPNSAPIALLGFVAIVFLYVLLLSKRGSSLRKRPEVVVLALFGLFVILNFSLLMFYHWGQLDNFEVSRLSLPLYLLMAMSIIVVLHTLSKRAQAMKLACVLAAILLYGHALPTSAKATATRTAIPTNETAWQVEFLKSVQAEDMLYISRSTTLPIVFNKASVPLSGANAFPENILYHMKVKSYSSFYVFQRMSLDPETGEATARDGHEVSEAFELETVAEKSFAPFWISRISRIVGVDAPLDHKAVPNYFFVEPEAGSLKNTALLQKDGQSSSADVEDDPLKDPLIQYYFRLP